MQGPTPAGHHTAGLKRKAFQQLKPGRRYEVIAAFDDHDGDGHPVGERWTFLTYNYVPYHDGLTLIVSLDGDQEWLIPMLWLPEGQGPVVDDLPRYVRPADGEGGQTP